ncbi:UNVERIFIED_CONTAM: Retrovirus-related Pol polyprotein from transposon RE2 [Sesamum latifolium]|uniref:Retrovirus-related Pol polyprotein from transposon RE2 n=1 Tax=Sesamum latifolium TaxID=2727402 RepID=A0AAW2UI40_9LAMI
MAETADAGSSVNKTSVAESLQLHGSDHPGMILISSCLTDIVEGLYTKSARRLWLDLEERYGGCNGPQLYHIRQITSASQGTADVGAYFTKLRKLWDELDVLMPTPQCTCNGCTCGASKAVADLAVLTQLLQFLMGLNDEYVHVRNQVLVMDPIPNVNRAYAMVVSVEKQREERIKLVKHNNLASQQHDTLQVNFAQSDDFTSKNCALANHRLHSDNGTEFLYSQCRALFTNTTPTKQKFDPRANKCVFLGYSQIQKAYKVYDLFTYCLYTSRDVVFHETTFPFQQIPTETEQIPLPIPFVDTTSESGDTSIISPPLEPPTESDQSPQTSQTLFPLGDHNGRFLNLHGCLTIFVIVLHILRHITLRPLSPLHMSFMAHLSSMQEPKNYLQASKDDKWIAAMAQEIQALENNDTWEVNALPRGKKAIGFHWVFKLKLKPDGSIDMYKARLVAKGYAQIEGVDYLDSFSPVAKSVTMRVFFAVATSKNWPILQLDVNNSFLHDHLDEEVYLQPPKGYTRAQPGQNWIVKAYLDGLFTIKDLGHAKYFVGLELARSQHGLIATQSMYLQDILLDTNMVYSWPVSTPLPPGLYLTMDTGSLLPFPDKFRRLVGRLLYLGFTRPDISFAVQQLSQFLQHPRSSH